MDSKDIWILRKAQKITPLDLPLGVYIQNAEGEILEVNKRAREILNLPKEGQIKKNAKDFYRIPEEREPYLKTVIVAENKGKPPEGKKLELKTDDKNIWVIDTTRSIRDPNDNNNILGWIGCLVDITEEESFRELFNEVPAGLYKLDADNKIIKVNPALLKMLDYDNDSDSLLNKQAKIVFPTDEDFEKFKEKVMKEKILEKEIVELKKKNGEIIITSINAKTIFDDNGIHQGREGVVFDVTSEERYKKLLNNVPVGTYLIKYKENKQIIEECNNQFAKMFEFESIDDAIGKDVLDLWDNPDEEHDPFLQKMEEKYRSGKEPKGFELRVKTSKGRKFVSEVFARPIFNRNKEIIGRAGAIIDISDEVNLKKLRKNIGNVLHTYSSLLLMLKSSLKPLMTAMGPDPFEGKKSINIDEACTILDPQIDILLQQTKDLLKKKYTDKSFFTSENLSFLNKQIELLENYMERILYPELRIPVLNTACKNIITIIATINNNHSIKNYKTEILNEAKLLSNQIGLYNSHKILKSIVEMDYELRSLREFIYYSIKAGKKPILKTPSSLISISLAEIQEYTTSMGCKIQRSDTMDEVLVCVRERSIIRVLANLIQNAIKYSWSRATGLQPWIDIRTHYFNDNVKIEIENWGVPITGEEIEKGLIFQAGFRGELSRDKHRLGTGIGLYDAKTVIEGHDGDIEITSRPASGKNPDDYDQPFITTVTVTLPILKKSNEKGDKNV